MNLNHFTSTKFLIIRSCINETSVRTYEINSPNIHLSSRFDSAKKDNDFVYHEKVPPLDSLPEIKGNICSNLIYFTVHNNNTYD